MIPSIQNSPNEYVIYNYDVREQTITLLHRGAEYPAQYGEYNPLWQYRDKERHVQPIIISI